MNLTAIILAGGYAKRLWPLTKNKPKPLLPVAGKPILEYVLEKVIELNINHIVLSTNMRFKVNFEKWLEDYGLGRVEVVADKSYKEEEKPGAVKALAELTQNIKNDCLILAGDNIFTSSLKDMVKTYKRINTSIVALYNIKDLKLAKKFSTAILDQDNRIVEFIEKPTKPKTTLIGTCIYIFPKKTLPRIREYIAKGFGKDEPGRFIEWLCKQEPVYGYMLNGEWWDIGTPETYKKANEHFLSLLTKEKIRFENSFTKREA